MGENRRMLESKRRAIIFISISLILALVAGYMLLKKVQELNEDLGGMTKIYVASDNIASRAIITPKQVETIDLPNKFVTPSHVTDPADITNRVSVVPLSKGDMITKNLLKPISEVANENNRLISFFANEKISFDQDLEALDRVDIIVSQQFEGKPKTEIFMTDVPVSMVAKSEGNLRGVALEVSKEQAPKLIHMQHYADSIRVLKANVGKTNPIEKPEKAEEKPAEKIEEKPVEKKAEEKQDSKPAEENPAEQGEKPAEQKPPGQG